MRKLIIVDDEGRRTTVPLVRSEITIGREEGNTIRLTERNVSRRHARIYRNGEGYLVEDWSRYGTRRNGARMAGIEPFDEGDVIIIGSYRVEMVDENADALPEPPVPDVESVLRNATEDLRAVGEGGPSLALPPTKPDTSARARLICMSDPFVGSEFALTNDQMTIGTSGDCDLIIGHRSVAPHHAMFSLRADGYELDPLDAGYPVAVNGRYNPHGPLRAGDEVLLGELKFRFALPGEDIRFVPLAEIADEPVAAGRPAWLLPAVVGAIVVLVVALVVAFGGEEETPAPAPAPAPGAERAPATTVSDAIDAGRIHLAAARWAEALRSFESVGEDDPDRAEAVALADQARVEAENRDRYEAATAALDEGAYDRALELASSIPDTSYYRALVTSDGLVGRAATALVAARLAESRVAEQDGDFEEARRLLEDVRRWAPDDAALAERAAEVDAAEAAAEAQRQQAAREAARPADTRSPQPPGGTARPSTPRTTAAPAPAEAPAETSSRADRRERAAELRQQAARAGIQQNYQEAVRLLEEARELNPGDAQLNLMLFSNYRQIGNRSRAAAAIRRYLRQRPDDPRAAEYEAWLAENAPD